MRFLLRRLGRWAWPVMLIQSGPRDPTPPATHLTAGARPHPRAAEQIRRAPEPAQGVHRQAHVARRRMVPQQKVGVPTLHPPTRPTGQSQDRVCARSLCDDPIPVLAAVAGELSELAPERASWRSRGVAASCLTSTGRCAVSRSSGSQAPVPRLLVSGKDAGARWLGRPSDLCGVVLRPCWTQPHDLN